MKTSVIYFFIFNLLTGFLLCQTDSTKTKEYLHAMDALSRKDTAKAIGLFNESVKHNKDAASYFKEAELYSVEQTHPNLTIALQYLKKAIEIEPNNIQYRLLDAKNREALFYLSVINVEERQAAIIQYQKILEIDSTCTEALYNLGRLKQQDFLKFHNAAAIGQKNLALNPSEKSSMFRLRSSLSYDKKNEFENTPGNFPTLSYENEAQEDFKSAEESLLKALKYDSSPEKILVELSKLNIYNYSPGKAIEAWNSIKIDQPLNKDSHLLKGILFYSTKQFDKASEEFNTAISMMSKQEVYDFTINSVLILLQKHRDELSKMSKDELNQYIKQYWKVRNPLNITNENERLLEHYYRVAYSNLFFGNERTNLAGWKTDRGEILIRYGQPIEKIRYMQEIDDPTSSKPRTEVWNYGDMLFAFVDPMRNNSYQFAQPWTAMVDLNTNDDVINKRQTKPEAYTPTFAGPVFSFPYQCFQFRSKDEKESDVYISYRINLTDSTTLKERFDDGYNVGLFFFDKHFIKEFEEKKSYNAINHSNVAANSLLMTTKPDSGNLAFEMIRNKDKGVASYHGKFTVKSFLGSNLKMSDVVLASDVRENENIIGAFKRNNISILPNVTRNFSKDSPLFLYYEVYNFSKNQNNMTDFEQKITIQKKGKEGILNSVLGAFGLDKKGNKVSLTTRYQTQETDPQIYLQLDMSRYEAGDYIITVSVKDFTTGNETSNKAEFAWQ